MLLHAHLELLSEPAKIAPVLILCHFVSRWLHVENNDAGAVFVNSSLGWASQTIRLRIFRNITNSVEYLAPVIWVVSAKTGQKSKFQSVLEWGEFKQRPCGAKILLKHFRANKACTQHKTDLDNYWIKSALAINFQHIYDFG